MFDAGVRNRVQRLLEQYSEDECMLDAYWQWATNPTPGSAGYALEENGGFISTNLMTRYGHPAIEQVTRLADECRELRSDAQVDELQQAILAVLNGPVGQTLRDGVLRRLQEPTPGRMLLAAWLVNRARWYRRATPEGWVAGEFDWSLGIDLAAAGRDAQTEVAQALFGPEAVAVDLAREAVQVGIVNRLLYRNHTGRMEPKMRPGPRIPLSLVSY